MQVLDYILAMTKATTNDKVHFNLHPLVSTVTRLPGLIVPHTHCPLPFHSQEWSISIFSCSLSGNITSHSMKNLAFHSLLRWKMLILFKRLWECILFAAPSPQVVLVSNYTQTLDLFEKLCRLRRWVHGIFSLTVQVILFLNPRSNGDESARESLSFDRKLSCALIDFERVQSLCKGRWEWFVQQSS